MCGWPPQPRRSFRHPFALQHLTEPKKFSKASVIERVPVQGLVIRWPHLGGGAAFPQIGLDFGWELIGAL